MVVSLLWSQWVCGSCLSLIYHTLFEVWRPSSLSVARLVSLSMIPTLWYHLHRIPLCPGTQSHGSPSWLRFPPGYPSNPTLSHVHATLLRDVPIVHAFDAPYGSVISPVSGSTYRDCVSPNLSNPFSLMPIMALWVYRRRKVGVVAEEGLKGLVVSLVNLVLNVSTLRRKLLGVLLCYLLWVVLVINLFTVLLYLIRLRRLFCWGLLGGHLSFADGVFVSWAWQPANVVPWISIQVMLHVWFSLCVLVCSCVLFC